jgi:O-antigen ligase
MSLATLQRGANTGSQWCLIALGFTLPISVALDNLLIALFILFWFTGGELASKFRAVGRNPVAVAALGLALIFLIGMTWSGIELRKLGEPLIDTLRFALLAIFAHAFLDAAVRRRAATAFLIASTLILLISYGLSTGVLGALPGIKGNASYPVVFKYHITHNLLMAFATVLFALRAMNAQTRWHRAFMWLLALAAACNVFLMIPGRTGQLALACAIVYLGFARFSWRGLVGASAAMAVLASAIVLNPNLAMHARSMKALEEASAWKPGEAQPADSSIGLRLEFYRNSLALIAERPLFGAGTGAFKRAYAERLGASSMLVTDHPHNAYLEIGVQLGLLGLCALAALLITQWRAAGTMAVLHDRAAARSLVILFAVAGLVSSTFSDHTEGWFYAWASAMFFATATWRKP